MTTGTTETAPPVSILIRPRRRPQTEIIVGACALTVVLALSFLAQTLTGHDPDDFVGPPFSAPSPDYLFGTDSLGRDVFVRTFVAARVDYLIAVISVVVSLLIGSTLGILVGIARRGIWSTLLLRVTDALIAVPFPLLILLVVVGFGTSTGIAGLPPGVAQILLAVFIVGWALYARLARAEASSLRNRDFIVAAELMGFSKARITFRHILPHVMTTVLTYSVADAVMIVGFVASLPFLGAGVPPPTAEWGSMMFDGRSSIDFAWWQILFPGLALALSAVAASLIADGLVARQGRQTTLR